MRSFRAIFSLAILTVILTACGSPDAPTGSSLAPAPPTPPPAVDSFAGVWIEAAGIESARAHNRLRDETCDYARAQKTTSGHVMVINEAGEIYSYDPDSPPRPERMIQWIDNGVVRFSDAYAQANRSNFATLSALEVSGRIEFERENLVLTYNVTGIDPVRIEFGRVNYEEATNYLKLLSQCVRRR